MVPWFSWIRFINPIAYGFESLMINEFDGRRYSCAQFIPFGPGYENASGLERLCATKGAEPGLDYVDGRQFLITAYNYQPANLWRNIGILLAFAVFFNATYLIGCELVTAKKSKVCRLPCFLLSLADLLFL